jgi:aldehyde dehydrogenase (NAD+)
MNTIHTSPATTSLQEIEQAFHKLQDNQFNIGNTTIRERKAKLRALHRAVLNYRPQIREAMYQDFRKPAFEVDLVEIYPVVGELRHAIKNLRTWMSLHRVNTPLAMIGSSSFIKYEPKGVVLIISPWNFPFNLTFGPLASAIAAGNTAIIKPSEHTPHSSALMKKIISDVFEDNEVVLFEGGIETSQQLLRLPFNHIFFTGAPSIGKIVMEAAAKHLTSVTLELGGKSPTIVDETANIHTAARRIAWSKFTNNGQVCIAPDYVYVHEKVADQFVAAVQKYIQSFYSEDASKTTSYARMVNERHYKRVKGYVEEAIQKGATPKTGNQFDDQQHFIAPTVLTDVADDTQLMQHEIFGPVLPIHTFNKLDDAIQAINAKEKPLALYIYSKSKKNTNYILNNTRAGGGCINHSAAHFFNTSLPFGGSNNSGIGKGHGWAGFQAFSNQRGILKQHFPNVLELLTPPYNNWKQKIIDLAIKYF